MTRLSFVPASEFQRLQSLELSAQSRTALLATFCRINNPVHDHAGWFGAHWQRFQ